MAEEDKKELTANEKKSAGVRERWTRESKENTDKHSDRREKQFDYRCFDGLSLSKMQKEFVVTFMDAPYFGKKERRYEAYKKVFNPSNENSCKANCSAMLKKSKIKTAMRLYQAESLKNHKIEVTSESIESLRRRANYSVSTFYNDDGTCKQLHEIPEEWLVCIDNIKIDKKSNAGKGVIETKEYKLCDRDKALDRLQKLLGVYQEMENIQVSVPTNAGKNAIESAEGQNGNNAGGPRIVLNMSVGNPNSKE